MSKQVKITFGEMRDSGVTAIIVYCADHRCSHSIKIPNPEWSDDTRLSDIEGSFICLACGKRGATVRPDFAQPTMGTAEDSVRAEGAAPPARTRCVVRTYGLADASMANSGESKERPCSRS